MAASARRPSDGEKIMNQVGLLVFLGFLLVRVGSGHPLWDSAIRAFFIWLAVSLLGGVIRVLTKYAQYRQREDELRENLRMAREEEERVLRERRRRREKVAELVNMIDSGESAPGLGANEDEA